MRWNRKSQRWDEQVSGGQQVATAPIAVAPEAPAADEVEAPAPGTSAEELFSDDELQALGAQAIEGLREVIDPELGVNIIDLGLVYGISFGRGEIVVTMTLTTPGCPLHASLQRAAEQALHTVLPDYPAVTINLVWSPRWCTEMITPEGRRALGWQW